MNRLYRRILFFTATLVFLSLAPLVIFYAVGYRLGSSAADPVPVGVISVESFPRRAQVLLDDTEVGRTPHAITNQPPGNPRVRLVLPGYQSWEKNIPVAAALVTELRGIRLFPEVLQADVLVQNVRRFSLSPNRQVLAVVDARNILSLTDVVGTPIADAVPLRKTPVSLLWSPASSAVLVGNSDGTHTLVTLFGGQMLVRALANPTPVQTAVWDQRIPSRLIIHSASGELKFYNTTNGSSSLVAEHVRAFGTSNRAIFTAFNDGSFAQYDLQGELQEELAWDTTSTITTLLITPAGEVALWGEDGRLQLAASDTKLEEIAQSVQRAAWSPDGRMLLVQTDTSALYVYNVSDERSYIAEGELHLITRQSRPISTAEWFAGGQHLLLQIADELIVTEIDTRDHPIHTQLDTTNLGDALASVGEDGTALYYLKRTENQINLVQLPLVVTAE